MNRKKNPWKIALKSRKSGIKMTGETAEIGYDKSIPREESATIKKEKEIEEREEREERKREER